MESLTAQNLAFTPKVPCPCDFESQPLAAISYTFILGNTYLLDGWPWNGNGTLSWIIGGAMEPGYGSLLRNDKPYPLQQRRAEAWIVRWRTRESVGFPFRQLTVQQHIQRGLKTVSQPYLQTEEEIMRRFHLTPDRVKRPIHTLSHEAWRASCAIGLAHGKRIFCFPYLRPDFIDEYYDLWFREMIGLLKGSGALVLIPTTSISLKQARDLCDVLVVTDPRAS